LAYVRSNLGRTARLGAAHDLEDMCGGDLPDRGLSDLWMDISLEHTFDLLKTVGG